MKNQKIKTKEIIGKKMIRGKRYLLFLFQYVFMERLRGLDFTMRDTRLFQTSGGRYHGYSKTNEKHLREIFEQLSYKECTHFLDIGCGKGVVLKEAAKYPFQSVTGIEVQADILRTAVRNFEILRLEKRVSCILADAVCFPDYGKYDTFFLFNPFSKEIVESVTEKILASRTEEKKCITVIYHNPEFPEVFEKRGFQISNILHDSLKDYETYILKKV